MFTRSTSFSACWACWEKRGYGGHPVHLPVPDQQRRGIQPGRAGKGGGGEGRDVKEPGTAHQAGDQKGLTNVANLGIDDYSNEVFQVYANYVFDFKNIKDEMEFIKRPQQRRRKGQHFQVRRGPAALSEVPEIGPEET